MRNIYLIETDKPSRLFKDDFGKYFISINIDQEQGHFKPQNIYITDDSEIEDNWVLNTHNNEIYFLKDFYGIQPITKKIILTTDQDLIAEGIQSIDDTFLEWFVNNPSCEEVKVDIDYSKSVANYSYKIIIPQEEVKKECCKEIISGFYLGTTCPKCNKPFRSIIQETKQLTDLEIALKLEEIEREESKQESLEEAAEKYVQELLEANTIQPHEKTWIKSIFIHVAKSDAARDYWFEIFKKK